MNWRTQTTQVFVQHAVGFNNTTVEEAVPLVMPRVTQKEPKEMELHQFMTAEASVCRKPIAPHQIHYAPLYTMYVAPACKLPVGGTKEHKAPWLCNIRRPQPSDLLISLPLKIHNMTLWQRHMEPWAHQHKGKAKDLQSPMTQTKGMNLSIC